MKPQKSAIGKSTLQPTGAPETENTSVSAPPSWKERRKGHSCHFLHGLMLLRTPPPPGKKGCEHSGNRSHYLSSKLWVPSGAPILRR